MHYQDVLNLLEAIEKINPEIIIIAGGLGGVLVAQYGFNIVFIFVSALTFFSATLLLILRNDISWRRMEAGGISPEKPTVEP